VPHCRPPVEHRFKIGNPSGNHTQKGPYLLPLLKKLLNKKITIEDPETRKLVPAQVKDALLWRLILNGTQGETRAIVEIFDRIDGKVPSPVVDMNNDSTLINEELEIVENGHGKDNALKRYKHFIN